MGDVIDVHDLPENEVRFIQKLVNLIRRSAQKKFPGEAAEGEKIEFLIRPLGEVKGNLSRREIYDYL